MHMSRPFGVLLGMWRCLHAQRAIATRIILELSDALEYNGLIEEMR